jgi:hypothetical protein
MLRPLIFLFLDTVKRSASNYPDMGDMDKLYKSKTGLMLSDGQTVSKDISTDHDGATMILGRPTLCFLVGAKLPSQ